MRHMPPLGEGVSEFLSPIHNPAGVVWYNRSSKVSKDKCTNWFKNMLNLVGLPVDMFTNKSARMTLVTRMCAKGVPDEVGRRVSGHHTSSGYKRYDRTQALQMQAAVMVTHTHGLSYEDALAHFSKEFVEDKLVGNDVNLHPLVAKCIGIAPTALTSLQAASASNSIIMSPTVSMSIVEASVNNKEVTTGFGKGQKILQVANKSTVKLSNCTVSNNGTVKNDQCEESSDKWLGLFGSMDWDAVVKRDPILERHLGVVTNVTSNNGQIGIAPGCNFANCQVTVIINQKDKEG